MDTAREIAPAAVDETAGASTAGSERRRDRRQSEPPLSVTIAGTAYEAADWSLGGCRILGFQGSAEPGEAFPSRVEGKLKETHLGAGLTAVVAWHRADEAELGLYFMDLDENAWNCLEQLAIRRLRRPR